LFNPRLKPKLTIDSPNDLLNRYCPYGTIGKGRPLTITSKGVADQQLAEAEASRRKAESAESHRGRSMSPKGKSLSRSPSSSSVSTISTNRSRSRSRTPPRKSVDRDRLGQRTSRLRSRTPPRKRKHRSISSSRSRSQTPPQTAPGSHRKSRRHRTISPIDRGRSSKTRRGSHRSRTDSPSLDKSQITKHRVSLGSEKDPNDDGQYEEHDNRKPKENPRFPANTRSANAGPRQPRRERSLSPYSKRLALTQAMNM